MVIIGITGGIGSGKTTVVKMFAKFKNVAIYLADVEAKKLMNSSLLIKEALIKEFSEDVFLNGKLDRSFLASIVFNNKEKLKTLNSIVHPVVHKHLQDFIKLNSNKSYIIYENAILFENKSNLLCDKIITVIAPLDIKIERVMARDSSTREVVISKINNQWNDDIKTLQSHYVVDNQSIKEIEGNVSIIHNKLTKNLSMILRSPT